MKFEARFLNIRIKAELSNQISFFIGRILRRITINQEEEAINKEEDFNPQNEIRIISK